MFLTMHFVKLLFCINLHVKHAATVLSKWLTTCRIQDSNSGIWQDVQALVENIGFFVEWATNWAINLKHYTLFKFNFLYIQFFATLKLFPQKLTTGPKRGRRDEGSQVFRRCWRQLQWHVWCSLEHTTHLTIPKHVFLKDFQSRD